MADENAVIEESSAVAETVETNSQKDATFDPPSEVVEETPTENEGGEDSRDQDDEEGESEESNDNGSEDDGQEGGDGLPDGYSEELLKEVEILGLTREQALSLGNAEVLDGMLDRLAKAEKEDPAGGESEDTETGVKEKPVLDPEVYEDDLVNAFEEQRKEIAELKAIVGKQAIGETEARTNAMFEELAKELPDTFGEGGTRAMNRNSEEYKSRVAVLEEMDVLAAGYEARGREVSEKDLFNRAVRILHGDTMMTNEKKKISKSVKTRATKAINRATSRSEKDDKLTPTQRAVKNVREKLKEFGVEEGEGEPGFEF